MNIPNYLTNPRPVFVNYGRDLYRYQKEFSTRLAAGAERAARDLGLYDSLDEEYVEGCEKVGLDPRSDNLKAYFLIHQLESANGPSVMLLFQAMFLNGDEPLVFEDDDMFYYILGRAGTLIVAQRDVNTILKAITAAILTNE